MEDPQGTLSAESGPWNGVLNQLKELTKEMKNFTGEIGRQRERRQRPLGPFSPPRKCWTCRGNHLQRDCPEYAKERRDEGYYLDPRKERETPMERSRDHCLPGQQRGGMQDERRVNSPDQSMRDQGNGR